MNDDNINERAMAAAIDEELPQPQTAMNDNTTSPTSRTNAFCLQQAITEQSWFKYACGLEAELSLAQTEITSLKAQTDRLMELRDQAQSERDRLKEELAEAVKKISEYESICKEYQSK